MTVASRARCCPLLVFLALGACGPKPTQPPDDGSGVGEEEGTDDPVDKAQRLLQKGDIRGAEAVIDEALGKHSDNHELWFAKGVAQQAQGNDDGAIQAWTKALGLRPEFVPAISGVGAILLARGEFDAAIDRFEDALRLQPDFADAHYNIGLALLGAGQRDKALVAVERAATLAPNDPAIVVQLADMYIAAGKHAEAVKLAERVVAASPQDPVAKVVLGNALVKLAEYDRAIASYQAALALAPGDPDARLGLARAEQRAGKLADAARELETLTKTVPQSAVVWAEWGSVLAKQGELAGALTKFEKALALDPKFDAAHVRKIGALAEGKKCKEARAAYQALVDIEPADESLDAGKLALGRCGKR